MAKRNKILRQFAPKVHEDPVTHELVTDPNGPYEQALLRAWTAFEREAKALVERGLGLGIASRLADDLREKLDRVHPHIEMID